MRRPRLHHVCGAYLADDCTVTGDVVLGRDASIWYGGIVRGDVAPIRIGERTNIQDLACIHPQHDEDVSIGAEVVVGHAAVVHCRVVEDRCLIGINAVLLSGVHVGSGSIVGAGALVPPGRRIPERSLVVGSPARVVRSVTDAEYAEIVASADRYVALAAAAAE